MFFKFISYVYIMLFGKPLENKNYVFCFFSGIMILPIITAVTTYCVFILFGLQNNPGRQLLVFSLAVGEMETQGDKAACWTTPSPSVWSNQEITLSACHSGGQRCVLVRATRTSFWGEESSPVAFVVVSNPLFFWQRWKTPPKELQKSLGVFLGICHFGIKV